MNRPPHGRSAGTGAPVSTGAAARRRAAELRSELQREVDLAPGFRDRRGS